VLESLAPGLPRVEARVVGGGARSAGWNQVKANVLGVAYRRLARADLATWGAAIVAGHAVGLIPDMAEAAARASEGTEPAIVPEPAASSAYRSIVNDYIEWQKGLDRG
jgi:xylulokinase